MGAHMVARGVLYASERHLLHALSRIRSAGKLCQLYVSAQGARTIVSELGGQGFALVIRDVVDGREAEGLLHELGV